MKTDTDFVNMYDSQRLNWLFTYKTFRFDSWRNPGKQEQNASG